MNLPARSGPLARIDRLIRANLSLRVFVPLLALALVTTWYGLFYSVERFGTLTGGLAFMDMQPRLTADALFAQIRTYSTETIRFYTGWIVFDYAWPFVTFTTMLFITAWLFTVLAPATRWQFRWFIVSAYATVLMDWLENTGFIALVLALPAEPRGLATLTLGLHAAKLVCNLLFNALFWVLLLFVVISRAGRRLSGAGRGN